MEYICKYCSNDVEFCPNDDFPCYCLNCDRFLDWDEVEELENEFSILD